MTKYNVGDIVTGVVVGITNYGVFVKLDDECTGLIHISEISCDYVKNINDYVNIGETIKVKVLNVDNINKIDLSIKDVDYVIDINDDEKIVEIGSGFGILSNNLEKWIIDRKSIIDEEKR